MRRLLTIVGSGMLVALITIALPAASAMAGNAGWGWVIARNLTTTSYHPGAADYGAAYLNSAPTVKRYGTGHYKVSFPGMGLPGGIPLVSPLGLTPRLCNVLTWFTHGSKEVIDLQCWNYSGQKADSKFAVYFVRGQDNLGPLAYFWSYSPSANTTVGGPYTFNSSGGSNSVVRLATGHYRITLAGLGGENGNVQVSAYGTTPGVCRVEGWGTQTADQTVDVNCRVLGGQRHDMMFTLTFVNGVGLYGYPPADQSAGYVWADQPSTSSYYPDSDWNWASDAAANQVRRASTGVYTVRLPGLATSGGGAVVTNYGTGDLRCQLGAVIPSGAAPQQVRVRCFKPSGAPADAQFSFLFSR